MYESTLMSESSNTSFSTSISKNVLDKKVTQVQDSEHNYRDHSNEEVLCNPSKDQKKVDHPFPAKLHYFLSEAESGDGLSKIVSWQPHGQCFVIRNREEFVKVILGSWFRQSKFTSFQRQMNIYGFRRITVGKDQGGYFHELFLRGRPDLCQYIQRTKIKGNGKRGPSSPNNEPDFYSMPFLPSAKTQSTYSPFLFGRSVPFIQNINLLPAPNYNTLAGNLPIQGELGRTELSQKEVNLKQSSNCYSI